MNIQETKWAWRVANRALDHVAEDIGLTGFQIVYAEIWHDADPMRPGGVTIHAELDGWKFIATSSWVNEAWINGHAREMADSIKDAVYDWRPRSAAFEDVLFGGWARQCMRAALRIVDRNLVGGEFCALSYRDLEAISHQGECAGHVSAKIGFWNEQTGEPDRIGVAGVCGSWRLADMVNGGWRWHVQDLAMEIEKLVHAELERQDEEFAAWTMVHAESGSSIPALAIAA